MKYDIINYYIDRLGEEIINIIKSQKTILKKETNNEFFISDIFCTMYPLMTLLKQKDYFLYQVENTYYTFNSIKQHEGMIKNMEFMDTSGVNGISNIKDLNLPIPSQYKYTKTEKEVKFDTKINDLKKRKSFLYNKYADDLALIKNKFAELFDSHDRGVDFFISVKNLLEKSLKDIDKNKIVLKKP